MDLHLFICMFVRRSWRIFLKKLYKKMIFRFVCLLVCLYFTCLHFVHVTLQDVFFSIAYYRELKQLRRRRQLQKTIGLMIKTPALHVHAARFLVHFFDIHFTTSTWSVLIWRFIEDVDIRRRIFLGLLDPVSFILS